MKAWVLVKFGDSKTAFKLQERPDLQPAPGFVTVENEAFGLNFADVMARKGMYQDCPPLPAVIGYESVGIIRALGAGVSGLSVGQRVVAFTRFGGYATQSSTDARAVWPIPDNMDAGEAAALATQYCTAYCAAEEMTRIQPGDRVLIHAAAGGVGTALVQLAKYRGATVFGTAGSKEKLDYLRQMGVDHPINYQTEDFETVVRQICGSKGIDLAYDSLGGTVFNKSLKLLGSGGRIVAYGAAERADGGKNILKDLKLVYDFGFRHPIQLLMKSQGMIGLNMLRIADDRPETLQRCLKNVVELHAKGVLKPTVSGRFKADQLSEAHDFLEGRKSTGKIVVSW